MINNTLKEFNNRPMTWEEFKAMPWDERNEYIGFLRNNYKATCIAIAYMLGISRCHLSKHCIENGYTYKFNRVVQMTEDEVKRFEEFCAPLESVRKEKPDRTEWVAFKKAGFEIQNMFAKYVYKKGYTQADVAEMFNITESAYGMYLSKHKIKPSKTKTNARCKRARVKPNKPVPSFIEWSNNHKPKEEEREVNTIQLSMNLQPAQESVSKVIPIVKNEETGWVCSNKKLPENAGIYACIFVTGEHGVPKRSRAFMKFDGKKWDVTGNGIITHWLSIPEMPEQMAV